MKASAMRVQAGRIVCLDYTLTLQDGTVVDSSAMSGGWTYTHGQTRMPPGLEKGLEGLSRGDQVRLELAPEDAFGALNPDAFQDMPRERFPASALYIGYMGEVAGPGGTTITFRIHKIQDDTVTLDLNHPLAGQHVVFDVTVIHVQE
jgi:FKBP-type peptidyl-prolyl cis-trans isomerase SlyD